MPTHRLYLRIAYIVYNFAIGHDLIIAREHVNIFHKHNWTKRFTLKKTLTTISHLLGVSLLFILPEMVISVTSNEGPNELTAVVYGKAMVFVAVFYVNFYFLVPYCLKRSHVKTRFLCYNLILGIVAMAIISLLWHWGHYAMLHHDPGPPGPPPPPGGIHPHTGPHGMIDWVMLFRDAFVMVLTVALAVAIKLTAKWREHERMRHEAQSIQQQNELKSLKSQLNPHFLFNTLNTIYALIDINPEGARNAVHELSSMLRYALYDCHSTVTLNDEIKFVAAYLRLAKLRLPNEECLRTELNAADCGSLQMAPLLFINIIENSIKHTAPLTANEHIDIRITAENGTVTCVCSNSYLPETAPTHKGLGLRNLRRRLKLLYGAKALLTIDKSANRFTVTMQVDISNPPAFAEAAHSIDHSTTHKNTKHKKHENS